MSTAIAAGQRLTRLIVFSTLVAVETALACLTGSAIKHSGTGVPRSKEDGPAGPGSHSRRRRDAIPAGWDQETTRGGEDAVMRGGGPC
jgi:hypothetical protein